MQDVPANSSPALKHPHGASARGPASALHLAVGHLNASVRHRLSAGQLAAALRAGSVSDSSSQAPLVLGMFAELSPGLIVECAMAAGADVCQLQSLYQQALADGLPPVPRWEKAIEHVL